MFKSIRHTAEYSARKNIRFAIETDPEQPEVLRRQLNEKPAEFKEVPLGQGQVPWDAYLAAHSKR